MFEKMIARIFEIDMLLLFNIVIIFVAVFLYDLVRGKD